MKPQKSDIKHIQKAAQNECGFTLIDVAILTLVIGLLAAPWIQSYNTQQKRLEIASTNGNFAEITAAISAYYFNNGYYPCPADPTLGPDDITFGQENRTDDGDPATVDDCVTNSGDPNLPNPGDTVMWGAIPHKALKLHVDQTLDMRRHKITYSVTTDKTKDTTFNNPGIMQTQIVNNNENCETDPPPIPVITNGVHVTLISAGEDGAGAYDINGNLFAACNSTGTPTLDSENCDRDTVFILPKCALNTNTTAGALFYDDLAYSGDWVDNPSRIWDDATDPANIGSIVGHIGIATGNPEHPVDVAGNIRTSNTTADPNKKGNVHAATYCNVDGSECFEPASIADYDPKMNCANAMTGIAENTAGCLQKLPGITQSKCPNGQVATGLTAGGSVICSSI